MEGDKMQLLDIPEDVIERHLFKYLSWNDLLRLRKVCRGILKITNGYLNLKAQVERAPEIEINEQTGKTLDAFMAMKIPTEKIFLNNPHGYHFYEMKEASSRPFLDEHGPKIKHLRVVQITMWPTGREADFVNSFVNLQTFEASHFGWGRDINSSHKADKLVKRVTGDWHLYADAFPKSFKNLETISIGPNTENEAINKLKVTGEIFIHCQKLKKACIPFTWTSVLPRRGDPLLNGYLMGEFYFLGIYMKPRPNDVYSEQGRLKLYDFKHCHDDIGGWDEWRTRAALPMHWFASLDFMRLCVKAVEAGLQFANVSPYWFYSRDAKSGRFNSAQLGTPIKSLMGLHPCVMTLDMPNLEKITIPCTSRSVGIAGGERKPEWPALQSLDITVDDCIGYAWYFNGVEELQPFTIHEMMSIRGLYRLLFKNIVRENLAELEIKFEEEGRWREEMAKAVPRIEDVVESCPNLKRIKLGNWPGKNKGLLKIWERLPKLEDIELEHCRDVGNVTFVGEEKENPVFLKLKSLRKLTLKGLDKMPKITDLLFTLVLAKMSLKELVLTCDKPLKKVTKEGITALLQGPFAETIETFRFQNWSLKDVNPEEFQEMEKKFRSYEML